MRVRLVEVVRCVECRARLRLEDPLMQDDEVMEGRLTCTGCGRCYPIRSGVPQFCDPRDLGRADVTARTASAFGYLWGRSLVRALSRGHQPYHVDRMARALSLGPPRGLVLDAGCGEGIDLADQARRGGAEIIGVELSAAGCRVSFARSLPFRTVSVLRGDVCQLPFDDEQFNTIYSYGVLHHLAVPERGLRELVRVLKPSGLIAVYLYEDFRERARGWRWLLRVVSAMRRMTTRLSPTLLYRLCQLGSPVIFLIFTVPFKMSKWLAGRSLGRALDLPFRHATGPFSLARDLYDRFSAPIERRYGRQEAVALLEAAGLQDVRVVWDRGWMVAGLKPELSLAGIVTC